MDPHRLPWRQHADRQGAFARAEGDRARKGQCAGLSSAMRWRRAIDDLAEKAGRLGLRGVPVFVFQEGHDAHAERTFKEIARLSNGAWFRFDRGAAASARQAAFGGGGVRHRRPDGAGGARPAGRPADASSISRVARAMTLALAILAVLLLVGLRDRRPSSASTRRGSPARWARGAVAAGVVGGVLTWSGRAGLGGMLLSAALAWYAANRERRRHTEDAGQALDGAHGGPRNGARPRYRRAGGAGAGRPP